MHSLLERLCTESAELKLFLGNQEPPQLSYLQAAEDNSRKVLVLSAASLFEHRITEALLAYAHEASNANKCIVSLIKNKAIKRQFHTFFDWKSQKAGAFYTLLGEDIGAALKAACTQSPRKEQLDAFLVVGYLRNCMVHQNFAEFPLDQSADDIRTLCELADSFVEYVETLLK
jgi:hypothetical protein